MSAVLNDYKMNTEQEEKKLILQVQTLHKSRVLIRSGAIMMMIGGFAQSVQFLMVNGSVISICFGILLIGIGFLLLAMCQQNERFYRFFSSRGLTK